MGIKDKWATMSGGQKGGVIAGGVVAAILLSSAIIVPTVIYTNPNRSLNDENVNVWVPWGVTSNEYAAFQEIVNYYNDHNGDNWDLSIHKVGDGSYKESGYDEISNVIKSDLNSGQKGVRKLPDLVFNGQDTLSILATWGDEDYTLDLAAHGVDSTMFNDDFKQTNVSGVDITEDSVYAVPLVTTQSLGINLPLLNYFIENSAGNITNSSSIDLSEVATHSEDATAISKVWSYKGDEPVAFDITDDTFKSMTELEALGEAIIANFEYVGGESIEKNGAVGIIGFTNPQTELMTMTQSMGADIITSTEDGSYYNFLHEGEAAYDNASQVYGLVKAGIESGVYWLPNGANQYSSGPIGAHEMLITVGSTSGTTYNTTSSTYEEATVEEKAKLNKDEILYLSDTSTFDGAGDVIFKQQGPSMMAIDHKTKDQDERTEQTVNFINWFISEEAIVEFEGYTPSQHFGSETGYVVGTNSGTEDGVYDESAVGANLVLEQMNHATGTWMAEAADNNTASFWNKVQTSMKVEQEQYLQGNGVKDWNTFSSEIYEDVKTNNWEAPAPAKSLNNKVILDNKN